MNKWLLIFWRACIVSILACLCLGVFGSSFAASRKVYSPGGDKEDRFSISLGGFLVRFDTKARVDSDTLGVGTEIDLENQTALKRSDTDLMLDGRLRLGRRHYLDFEAKFFSRRASTTIDEEIQFEDEIFDIDADVSTKFDNDVYKLAYRFSFLKNDRVEAGVSLGISAFDVGVALSAEGEGGAVQTATEDFIAPIPVLGLRFDVPLGGEWFFRAGGEYFKVSVDDHEGSLSDIFATFDWYPFEHFGFGVGYNRVNISYNDLSGAEIDFSYTYSGTMIYATYVF
jgi:hypothetical protein